MISLGFHHVQKKYYETTILEDVHFDLHQGEKIGLIGRNGAGKTTLFKLITEEEPLSGGMIQKHKETTIGYLAQVPGDQVDTTVNQVLHQPFEELITLENHLRHLEGVMASDKSTQAILNEYAKCQEAFELKEGYDYPFKIKKIVEAFKLNELLNRQFNHLSGGEKTRVALAKLLLTHPDVLLLDEPTNHLDTDMLAWLEEYLSAYDGAVMIISHDRYFLDQTVDKIVEIDRTRTTVFHGNYTLYTIEKQAQVDLALKAYKEQQKKIKSIEATIKRFRAWAQKSDNEKFYAKAKQFEKRLADMDRLDNPLVNTLDLDLALTGTKKSSKRMIIADQVGMAFDGHQLFSQVSFEVFRGQKVCLMGLNGVGKTTLLRGLMNQMAMTQGQLKVAENTSVGYLQQEVTFESDDMPLTDVVIQIAQLTLGQARNLLARYGFKGQDVFRRVGSLSGGEKSRLMLMLFTLKTYQLMLLDEPTNHLDIQTKEELETTLNDFEGTVFFISHDRYFINMVADAVLVLSPDGAVTYAGNYDDYQLEKTKSKQETSNPQVSKSSPTKAPVQVAKKINTFKVDQVEVEIGQLEAKLEAKRQEMALCSHDYVKLSSLQVEIDSLESALHDKMDLWMTYQNHE